MIRAAEQSDLDRLLEIEQSCFVSDGLSKKQFRYMLTHAKAITLVVEHQGVLCGYALLLLHAKHKHARLYSIAVKPDSQGKGIGKMLMQAVEQAAQQRGRTTIKLEVRPDNEGSIKLYERLGYQKIGIYSDFYADHKHALRYEKKLLQLGDAHNGALP